MTADHERHAHGLARLRAALDLAGRAAHAIVERLEAGGEAKRAGAACSRAIADRTRHELSVAIAKATPSRPEPDAAAVQPRPQRPDPTAIDELIEQAYYERRLRFDASRPAPDPREAGLRQLARECGLAALAIQINELPGHDGQRTGEAS